MECKLSMKVWFYMFINMSGEYWVEDVVKLERSTLASGGNPPPSDAYTINGQPGPNYNCSQQGKLFYMYIVHKFTIYLTTGLNKVLILITFVYVYVLSPPKDAIMLSKWVCDFSNTLDT